MNEKIKILKRFISILQDFDGPGINIEKTTAKLHFYIDAGDKITSVMQTTKKQYEDYQKDNA